MTTRKDFLRGQRIDPKRPRTARSTQHGRLERDRRRHRRAATDWRLGRLFALPPSVASPPEADAESEVIDRQLVRRVLDLASEECRELIRAYFYEARNYEEIAGVHGVPVGTVKSRLFRCLESAHQSLTLGWVRSRHPKS